MKQILAGVGMVLLCFVVVFGSIYWMASNLKKTKAKSSQNSVYVSGATIREVEFKGHFYLFFYQGSMIHAEHCPCKSR